ncbi:glycosyl transferase family 28 [Actinomyces lilanjuaniae]|uniref:Glycosyl transferase family 28 n=2 Tax=Actinomyces lilanjuaniae TaxID=2321394 RepID=A0ABM6Z4B7_9ACTO|nr:glycosyl transferase family 28 [Actinomyces lilanjuaniae]
MPHTTATAAPAVTSAETAVATTVPAAATAPTRVMLYSHDAQGLGHLRRNLALAHHLARLLPGLTGQEVTGMVVTGLPPAEDHTLPPGFDWLVLPGVAKSSSGYQPRHLRITRSHLGQLRSQMLGAALTAFAPDLLIIDRHPYGVRHELREPLRVLRRERPSARVVLGLREVLDTPRTMAREWDSLGPASQMRRLIDQIWVYGDPEVHNIVATSESPWALNDRVLFTGYLAHGRQAVEARPEHADRPFVLTTVGGGSDGYALLRAAVSMTPPPGHDHIVVAGPQMSEKELRQAEDSAGPRTQVRRSLPGMSHHIAEAAAVIAMAGYNTVCEILATSTPALLVPREVPRQEQVIRARALSRVGAVEHLELGTLTPEALSRWAAGAVEGRQDREHLDLDGLDTVPRLAASLLSTPTRRDRLVRTSALPAEGARAS